MIRKNCIVFISVFALLFISCGGGGGDSGGGGGVDPVIKSPNIALSQTSHSFEGIVVNNTADRSFIITNSGDADLTIKQIPALSAPFSISVDTCSNSTLKPQQSCLLRGRFAPKAEGTFNGQLSIPSNDPDTSTATIALSGKGYGLNVWINSISANKACNVGINATVIDAQGNRLASLAKDNFSVVLNDKPITDFTVSTNQFPSPVSLVVMLDWSPSERGVIGDVKTGAKNFIDQLSGAGGGEAAICKFHSEVAFYPSSKFLDVSSNASDLKTYIDSSFTELDGTALYDAIYAAITRAASGTQPQKAVVILSDGVDAHSNTYSFADVANYAIQNNVPLFTIYFRDPAYSDGTYGSPDIMRLLAQTTGGQFYDGTTNTLSLTEIYKRIANTLSNKYLIEFTASSCSAGVAYIDVLVSSGGSSGKDSSSVIFP